MNLLSGFSVQLVPLVGEGEHPEAAFPELRPRGEDVGQEEGQATVVVEPPDVEESFSLFTLKKLISK